MSESEALKVWEAIRMQFGFDVDIPDTEEIEIIKAYNNGDDEYQPYISHSELKKELGL